MLLVVGRYGERVLRVLLLRVLLLRVFLLRVLLLRVFLLRVFLLRVFLLGCGFHLWLDQILPQLENSQKGVQVL